MHSMARAELFSRLRGFRGGDAAPYTVADSTNSGNIMLSQPQPIGTQLLTTSPTAVVSFPANVFVFMCPQTPCQPSVTIFQDGTAMLYFEDGSSVHVNYTSWAHLPFIGNYVGRILYNGLMLHSTSQGLVLSTVFSSGAISVAVDSTANLGKILLSQPTGNRLLDEQPFEITSFPANIIPIKDLPIEIPKNPPSITLNQDGTATWYDCTGKGNNGVMLTISDAVFNQNRMYHGLTISSITKTPSYPAWYPAVPGTPIVRFALPGPCLSPS